MERAYKFGLEFNFGLILEKCPILDFASGLAIRVLRCGKDVEKSEKGGESLGVEMWKYKCGNVENLVINVEMWKSVWDCHLGGDYCCVLGDGIVEEGRRICGSESELWDVGGGVWGVREGWFWRELRWIVGWIW